jgi:hypothetical protein
MVDVAVLVREHLLNQQAVVALLGANANGSVYASCDLPEHVDLKLGPVIQIFRSGGISDPEITALVRARLNLRVWADVEEYQVAADVYGAIHDTLHGATNVALQEGTIMSALEATGPQEITDPETAWVSVFQFTRPRGCV